MFMMHSELLLIFVLVLDFCWQEEVSLLFLHLPFYSQLEEFLVANREEYLRHSAMNYTSQQRQYNNRLTERLLELAAQHGYVFDEEDFDFVTVRDRIRCYYKSYVQSKRKKGIKVGYAPEKKKAKKCEDKQQKKLMEVCTNTEVSSAGK